MNSLTSISNPEHIIQNFNNQIVKLEQNILYFKTKWGDGDKESQGSKVSFNRKSFYIKSHLLRIQYGAPVGIIRLYNEKMNTIVELSLDSQGVRIKTPGIYDSKDEYFQNNYVILIDRDGKISYLGQDPNADKIDYSKIDTDTLELIELVSNIMEIDMKKENNPNRVRISIQAALNELK